MPYCGWFLRGKKSQSDGISSWIRRYLPHPVEVYNIWEMYCGKKFLFNYLIEVEATEREISDLRGVIKKTLYYQKKKRFVAKYTGPSRITYINSIFPDAYFVHIIRDPKAVVSSLMKVGFWRKNDGGLSRPWWDANSKMILNQINNYENDAISLAAIQWKIVIENAIRESQKICKERYIEIKYENFLNSPRDTINNILKFTGLKISRNVDNYFSSIFKYKNTRGKYKKNLTHDELLRIQNITGDIAKNYGYNI